MISQTDWSIFANHTHFYGIGTILGAGNFSSGSTPMFAVIGANNICYYNGNDILEVESALNLAVESFETIELIADFNVSSTNIYLGDEVQFTDNSIGEPLTWAWDFENDGVYDSSEQHPSHIYNSEGTYSIKLKVTRNTTQDILIKEDLINVEIIPPASPENVQIEIDYPDIVISWSEVITNVIGEPITPDGYFVLYSDNGEDYFNLRYSRETMLFHNDMAANRDQMFYQVVTFISISGVQTEYLEGLNDSPGQFKWSEVKQNLKNLATK